MHIRFLTTLATSFVAIFAGLAYPADAVITSQEAGSNAAVPGITFNESKTEIQALFDGELFTSLHFDDVQKPFLYPVISAHGAAVTRAFPMMGQHPGEAADHPHHTSLWFAHGDVNGHDFWHGGGGERIVHLESKIIKDIGSDGASTAAAQQSQPEIQSTFEWRTGQGEVVCTEARVMRFGGNESTRFIDFDFALTASMKKELTFGDTKEGTFGIRLAPTLRLKGEVAEGTARNSAGVTGGEVWGQRARWIEYSGPVNEEPVSVAIFDHPDNPRHPTWWHAREYGLVAANPFGRRAFEGRTAESGNLKLQPGKTVHFRYRVVVHDGSLAVAELDKHFEDWSTDSKVKVDNDFTLERNFDDAKAAEDFVFSDPATWQVDFKDGNGWMELVGASAYTPPKRSPHSIALIGSHQVGEFTLEADLLQTGRQYGHRDLCIFFGFQDPAHFYYAHLAAQTDDHAHNIFVVDGAPRTKISTKTTNGVEWGTDQWHHIKIERKLNPAVIRVFFDDMTTPIMVAEDGRYEWGYVGFGSFDDSGYIDNIRLRAPKAREHRAEFFEPLPDRP